MSVALLLMNNLYNSKKKRSNLLSPVPPLYSWSLLANLRVQLHLPTNDLFWLLWLSPFYSALWISTEVVYTYSAVCSLHGWCHVKLLPSWRKFCVQHTTVRLSLYSKPYMKCACVFSCNQPPAPLAEWPGSSASAVRWGWNGYRQHNKLIPEERKKKGGGGESLLPGLEPETFLSLVRRSDHRAIPAPDTDMI